MYCMKCGRELKNEWNICPACGTPTNVQTNTGNYYNQKKKGLSKIIIAIVAIFIVAIFIAILALGKGDVISEVKDSTLPYYSEEVTIGEAFDSYFDSPKWSTYEQGGKEVICFSGFVYSRADDKIKVTMEMSMNGDTLMWDEVILYNVDEGDTTYLTDLELESLLNAIYEGGSFTWVW